LGTAAEAENTTGSLDDEDLESDTEDFGLQNVPARNTSRQTSKVPILSDIPYTRTALFDLLKIMEYTIDRETYDMAWQRL
jgi:hypothetical protein